MNDTIRQVVRLPLRDVRGYLRELAAFNRTFEPHTPQEETIYEPQGRGGLVLAHNQLPCEIGTRRRRADLLAAAGHASRPVLLLGDDDLLSIELCKRGFRDVTVADCDERLLRLIEEKTAALPCRPKLVSADFRTRRGIAPKAAAICLDPPQTPRAVDLFLAVARANGDPAGHSLYLMYNPWLLGSAGSTAVHSGLAAHGYELERHHAHFNAYPLARVQTRLLRLAFRLLVERTRRPPPDSSRLYYFSDCFQYRFSPRG